MLYQGNGYIHTLFVALQEPGKSAKMFGPLISVLKFYSKLIIEKVSSMG